MLLIKTAQDSKMRMELSVAVVAEAVVEVALTIGRTPALLDIATSSPLTRRLLSVPSSRSIL